MDLAARSDLRLLPRPPPGSAVASSFLSTTLILLLGLRTSRYHPSASTLNVHHRRPSTPLLSSPTLSPSVFSLARRNSFFSVVAVRKGGSFSRIMCSSSTTWRGSWRDNGDRREHQLQYSQREQRRQDFVLSTRICRAGLRPSGS